MDVRAHHLAKEIMMKLYLINTYLAFSMLHVLLLVFCSLQPAFAATDPFIQCLSNNRNDQFANISYTPISLNYTTVLQDYIRNARFNTSTTPKPQVIVTPWEESQVQDIVSCAKKVGLQLTVRSGGHDNEGLSYTSLAPFVLLDMFNLRKIEINMEEETVWAQAGATVGEVYYGIWEKSNTHAFAAGVCPTVGLGGHVSGGGYGNLMRKYGLSIDSVIDAKIVDAKGRILDRKGMGEDVFWAIRGGGGASFGVIVSYKIKLVRVPPVLTVFNVPRTLEQNATDLIHRWQYIGPQIDNDLFIRLQFRPVVGENNKNTTVVEFIALYLGDAEKLLLLMNAKFPELGLKKSDCKEMSWIKTALFWYNLPDGTPETVLLNRITGPAPSSLEKSDYVKSPIPKDTLQGMLDRIAESGRITMQFEPYGGRMSEIPESATAFPHRAGNLFKIQYLIVWDPNEPKAEERYAKTIRDLYSYMTPYVSKNPREAFLNYRDIDLGTSNNGPNAYEQAKVYGVKYFKNNFDPLVAVKTKFDPENFFRNKQSIPPLRK